MKYLTEYITVRSSDTSAFETAALAIIGDKDSISDIPDTRGKEESEITSLYENANLSTGA